MLLRQIKASVVAALFLVFLGLLAIIGIWQLGKEVVTFHPEIIIRSWSQPTEDRVQAVLQERHTDDPDASFHAYQLIQRYADAGDRVYLLREFDLSSLVAFYRLMSLSYPRELFPLRELGKGWVPPDRRDGQRVFVLDFSSVLTVQPGLTVVEFRGSCTIWAYKDID